MRHIFLLFFLLVYIYSGSAAQPGKPVRQIQSLLKKVDSLYNTQDSRQIMELYAEALKISEKAHLTNYTIMICLDLSTVQSQLNKPKEALFFINKAANCYSQYKDRSVQRKFMIEYHYAATYLNDTRLDSASYFFNQCATLIRTYPDSLKSFNFYLDLYYLNRSYMAQEMMAYNEAISLNQESIRRSNIKYKTKQGAAGNFNSLARSLLALNQFAKADSAFLKSVAMYADNPLFQAIVLSNLVESKVAQNDPKAARTALQQAQQAYQKYFGKKPRPDADTDVERRLKQSLANVLLAEGNLPAADRAFAHFFAFCKTNFPGSAPFRVDSYLSLSRLNQKEGKLDAARKALNAAVREAYGPNNQRWERATLPRSLVAALTEKAHFLANSPASTPAVRRINLLESLHDYETIIDLTASLRRGALLPESKAFLAQKSADLYGPALSICYELAQQPGAAPTFQNRAFALFDKQQNGLLADSQIEQQLARQYLPPSLQTEFRKLNQRLSQLRLVREESRNNSLATELAKTEKNLIDWQMRVDTEFPAYGKALRRVARLSIADYQQELASDEVLLCYAPTPTGLLVLTLDQKTCSFRRVPVSPAQLDGAIAVYRAEVSRDPGIVGAYDNRPARAVYTLLLAPVQDRLRTAKALSVVVPPAWQIPFEALENRAGRMLIYDAEVGYQFNLSGRLLSSNAPPAIHKSLTMAPFGADTGRGPFRMASGHLLRPLRASAQEANLLSGGLVRLGKQASKKRFLADAPNAQLMLLTTHTYPGERETALIFYPFDLADESGFLLYPSELQHADLRSVEFSGLSACATEKGVQLPGDGIHTLGRAVSWAGAQSVTCSWFLLNDTAQALSAKYFYPKLDNGKTVRQNLRQARLDFLASEEGLRFSGHPYYWSGVALYGGHNTLTNRNIGQNPLAVVGLLCLVFVVGWVAFRRKFPQKTTSP